MFNDIFDMFDKENEQLYMVGGCVRDNILGIKSNDVDFATSALPQKIIEILKKNNLIPIPIGIEFGTVQFIKDGQKYEITTFRSKENYRKGSRKPNVVFGKTIEEDLFRRDFCCNSIALDKDGKYIDPCGGVLDINSGVIKCPISPDVSFSDDPLRMLRAIRFAVKYNWILPMFMIRALKKNSSQLKYISQERVRDELNKMLVSDYPDKAIRLLKITNLLSYIIPELVNTVGVKQNIYHTKDVFGHILDVVKNTKPILSQRLMALFHDIGKPSTKTVCRCGRCWTHFYKHEEVGAQMTQDIMRRLKYSTELINIVEHGVKNHMRLKQAGDDASNFSDKALRKFRIEVGNVLEDLLDVIHSDNCSHSDDSVMPHQIENIRERLKNLKDKTENNKPKLPVDGNDLLQAFSLKPSKVVGKMLKAIEEKWYECPNISKEEALEIAKCCL